MVRSERASSSDGWTTMSAAEVIAKPSSRKPRNSTLSRMPNWFAYSSRTKRWSDRRGHPPAMDGRRCRLPRLLPNRLRENRETPLCHVCLIGLHILREPNDGQIGEGILQRWMDDDVGCRGYCQTVFAKTEKLHFVTYA